MKIKNMKAQNEMVGFAIIIIFVAILILVFLSISLNKHEKIRESPQLDSFLQAFLQYTTDCEKYALDYLDIWNLIEYCNDERICYDERKACDVLKPTVEGILNESWKINGGPTKGYLLNITSAGQEVFSSFNGNKTLSSQMGSQILGDDLEIRFIIYN